MALSAGLVGCLHVSLWLSLCLCLSLCVSVRLTVPGLLVDSCHMHYHMSKPVVHITTSCLAGSKSWWRGTETWRLWLWVGQSFCRSLPQSFPLRRVSTGL